MPLPQREERYTYEDYCRWDDGKRWELIEGVPYAMSPSPTQRHQEIVVELAQQLGTFLKGKLCKLFISPFDVRLSVDSGDDTVVQPDLLVVCDRSKLDGRCCRGAPDLVIEILSPSSSKYDRIIKLEQYQSAGVAEYWIVDPGDDTVQVYLLDAGRYYITVYTDADTLPVTVLPGCEISLQDVFAQ